MIIPMEKPEADVKDEQKPVDDGEPLKIDETPVVEMTKEEKEASEESQKKKAVITMIVGVGLNVVSQLIILLPMCIATKSTCKGLTSCGAIWGLPFIFVPAAVVTSIYASWISTMIYWHETVMDPNGKPKRDVPKKLTKTMLIVNGALSVVFLVVVMIVLSNQA
jgi:hypothetical protein